MRRIMKAIELTLFVVSVGMLAGCSSLNYVQDAPVRVQAADWSKMEKGTYEVTCTMPGHAEAGMTGRIRIE